MRVVRKENVNIEKNRILASSAILLPDILPPLKKTGLLETYYIMLKNKPKH